MPFGRTPHGALILMTDYTLDACALITLVNKETGAEMVNELIAKAVAGEAALNMSIVNLTEVYYGYLHDLGKEQAEIILQRVLSYPIRVINVITDTVFRKASFFKAEYQISLADSYACATAWWSRATLVASDHHELEALEQHEQISFLWLPPKPKK
jgi:PIN domain nuclease of toxin-antitoxin system